MAEAYTLFANGGADQPLRAHRARRAAARTSIVPKAADGPARRAADDDVPRHQHDAQRAQRRHRRRRARRPASRSTPPARSGTTNDLRDAWFVGFTPELLAVVWVGFDDNQPLGLERHAGGAADLDRLHEDARWPGTPTSPFEAPEGVSFVEIDRDTGKLALAHLPARDHRSVPRRHRAARVVRTAPVGSQ